MDKVFKVEITNGEPNGYLSATFLDLPASENEYIQAQVQAKVANSEKMETEVLQVYQGPVTTDMVDGALFSELNTLAAVLSQLDDTQAFALEGMLKIRQEATGTQKIAISDILHMADNTDRCMVATHIWDHLALGHLLYETELMPESAARLLDVTKAGSEYQNELLTVCARQWQRETKGVFVSQGYVEPDPEFLPFLLGQKQIQDESPQMGMSP